MVRRCSVCRSKSHNIRFHLLMPIPKSKVPKGWRYAGKLTNDGHAYISQEGLIGLNVFPKRLEMKTSALSNVLIGRKTVLNNPNKVAISWMKNSPFPIRYVDMPKGWNLYSIGRGIQKTPVIIYRNGSRDFPLEWNIVVELGSTNLFEVELSTTDAFLRKKGVETSSPSSVNRAALKFMRDVNAGVYK